MDGRLTTSQVAQRLNVAQQTVKLWCRQGRFPNAEIQETPRGPVWQIPEGDLRDFEPPTMGRPPKSAGAGKRATGRANANGGTSKGKKRGKK